MSQAQQRYRSQRGTPRCVKLWDRVFRNKPHWIDWVVTQGVLNREVEFLQSEGSTREESMDMVWNAFCASARGADQTPVHQIYSDLCNGIRPSELPEFVMWMTIGVDVHYGKSLTQAQEDFVQWLKSDSQNQRFPNGWRMLPSLEVFQEDDTTKP